MKPLRERSRPADNGPAKESLDDNTPSIAPASDETPTSRRRCRHLRAGRLCRSCTYEAIHAQIQLEQLAPVHAERSTPQTFGLTSEELIREANRLYAMGVPIGEIRQLLAVPLPDRAA
jgi:hypothetical protein